MSQLEHYKTLTDHLLRQAGSQPQQVALQYKYHGAWYFWNWQQLAKRVEQHAAALAADGFSSDDTLWLFSQPHADVLILTLAAQWLGGSVSLLDEVLTQDELLQLISPYPNRYVFVENKQQAARWFGLGLPASLVLYRDVSIQHIQQAESISGWLSQHSQIQHAAQPVAAQHVALHIYRPNSQQQNLQHSQPEQLSVLVDRQSLTDIDLLQEAEQLSKHAALKPHDKALATRGFDLAGQWRHLLATWLYAGFTYNFPETLETRDQDRRELQPTFLLGTPQNWARLSQLAQQHLPSHRSWLGRWANQQLGQRLGEPSVSALGRVQQGLVIRPLKQTLGLANVRVALVATSQPASPQVGNQNNDQQGAALDAETERLLLALGIQVVPWVDLVQWQPHALVENLSEAGSQAHLATATLDADFESALSRSSAGGRA